MFAKRLSVVLACAFAIACNRVPDSEVAARVNGQPITKKEFEEAVSRHMARYKGNGHELQPNIEQRIRESVLRRMIDDKMIELKAKEQGVAVAKDELDKKFSEHKARFRTDEAFADYLKRSQNTEDNMKDDLRRNLLRDRVVEKLSGAVEVTDDETKKYYDENVQRFTDREQVKLSRIVIRTTPTMTDGDKKKALAKAKQVLAQAKKADADFGKLAKENSGAPEAAQNGELNWITKGRLGAEIDAAAFALAPNAVSDIITTPQGYEIVKVWEKKAERVKPLEEVKETIQTSLLARKRNEKRRDVIRDLKAAAKVEQLITFDTTPPAGSQPNVGGAGFPAEGAQGMMNPDDPRMRLPRVPGAPAPEMRNLIPPPGGAPPPPTGAAPAPTGAPAPAQPAH